MGLGLYIRTVVPNQPPPPPKKKLYEDIGLRSLIFLIKEKDEEELVGKKVSVCGWLGGWVGWCWKCKDTRRGLK
jgi:hypothetical protein